MLPFRKPCFPLKWNVAVCLCGFFPWSSVLTRNGSREDARIRKSVRVRASAERNKGWKENKGRQQEGRIEWYH
jgi:hypothetical protein